MSYTPFISDILYQSDLFIKLKDFDTHLLLCINHAHNEAMDEIMYWASNKWFWIPLYFVLAVLIVKLFKKNSLYIFASIALAITLSDQISSGLIKHWVLRLRPSHEPALIPLIRLSKAGPGGLYGFVSAHAANAMALTVLLSVILSPQHKDIKVKLFIWTLLVSYSRIYNGVHYPSDVLGGMIVGATVGLILGLLTKRFTVPKNTEAENTSLS